MHRPLIIASVMASLFMIATESTIVATVMPQIVADLGGLKFYSWVFAAFLLSQTAMTVVCGKLADVYGRKPVMMAGLAIFLLASVLAGLAWSMPAMIVFRLIQGIGGGAVQPVAMTIVADMYPPRERGKIQGYLASVWASSSVVGPMLGALIIHKLSWSWIFWVNIPLALIAMAGFALFHREKWEARRVSIDVGGAALFTGAVTAMMVGLTDLGSGAEGTVELAGIAFVVFLALFVWQERRAADPMVSFSMWGRRSIAMPNVSMLFGCMAVMGITTFLPMLVQGVMHRTPVEAGFALTMIMLGWPMGATLTSRTFNRYGLGPLLILGGVFVPAGALFFMQLAPGSNPWWAGAGSWLCGFGMGFLGVGTQVMVQEIAGRNERGSVTASNIFARNLGSTLGAAVLGALFNYGLAHSVPGTAVTSEQIRRVLETASSGVRPDALIELAMQDALRLVFIGILALGALTLAAVLCIPRKEIPQKM